MTAMADRAALLELVDVSKVYETPGGGPPTPVLKDVSLQVTEGESLAVVGPSGSGKSTLLNIIGTLDRPTSGCVLLEGADLGELSAGQLARLRNREIGFIFQLHHLLPQLTVLENVLVPTLVGGWRPAAASSARGGTESDRRAVGGGPTDGESPENRAKHLLKRVGLGNRLSYRPGQLSGGERQRVAVVRALINRPKLLLADEPTGSLDRASADGLARLLVELNREQRVTLIVVTHDLTLASRLGVVYELRNGELRLHIPEARETPTAGRARLEGNS